MDVVEILQLGTPQTVRRDAELNPPEAGATESLEHDRYARTDDSFFISDTLSENTYVEKLTVMFSV
jgi:hypothetical protein